MPNILKLFKYYLKLIEHNFKPKGLQKHLPLFSRYFLIGYNPRIHSGLKSEYCGLLSTSTIL